MTLFPKGAACAPLMLGAWPSQRTVGEAGSAQLVTEGKTWETIKQCKNCFCPTETMGDKRDTA